MFSYVAACLVLSIMPSTKFNKVFVSFQKFSVLIGVVYVISLDVMEEKRQASRCPVI